MSEWTLLNAGTEQPLALREGGSRLAIGAQELQRALGWQHKPEGLCRGGVCLPVRDPELVDGKGGLDLECVLALLEQPWVADRERRVLSLGRAVQERRAALEDELAPDFELPDLSGRLHRLSEQWGKKVLLTVWASWCGCREDLPVWQALHSELESRSFSVMAVALDQSLEAARPFIERAAPTHPSLIDPDHVVAHRFGLINVPTAVWIDEEGRVVRPASLEYGSSDFEAFHGRKAEPFLAAVRSWVTEGHVDLNESERAARKLTFSFEEELARAEFALGWWLQRHGQAAEAEAHFLRAGELAPHDWTIRRGTLPIRGLDPMGADFFPLYEAWNAAGRPAYAELARQRQGDPDE